MATFVLVHGAWVGGWCWTPIARLLRAQGHEVFVPMLTGLGERQHLLQPAINLTTHVTDVVNMITAERLSDVILSGHSYGGMVITGVAGVIGGKIRSLVYLDAFLPENGQSLWDIADEPSRAFYMQGQRNAPGLIAFGIPPGIAPENESGPPPIEQQMTGPPWVGPHPLLTLTEPVKLSGEGKKVRNRTYVLATNPPAFQRFYDKCKVDKAWKTATMPTGHMLNLDDPAGTARLLLEEVGR